MANRTNLTQTIVSVTAGSSQVLLPRNPLRNYLQITNTGTNRAYIGFDVPAVVGDYPLEPAAVAGAQGGGLGFDSRAIPINAINVYCAGATTIVVLEGA